MRKRVRLGIWRHNISGMIKAISWDKREVLIEGDSRRHLRPVSWNSNNELRRMFPKKMYCYIIFWKTEHKYLVHRSQVVITNIEKKWKEEMFSFGLKRKRNIKLCRKVETFVFYCFSVVFFYQLKTTSWQLMMFILLITLQEPGFGPITLHFKS